MNQVRQPLDRFTGPCKKTECSRWSSSGLRERATISARTRILPGVRGGGTSALTVRAGFTLIEVLFVVLIIGIFASIAVPSYLSFVQKARNTKAAAEIRSIASQVDGYITVNETIPANLAQVGIPPMTDPWGQPYQYLNVKTAPPGAARKDKFLVPLNSTYDLYSRGKDMQSKPPLTAPESKDDIIRANDGQFLGLAYLY